MAQIHSHRHSIFCILPPYILRALAEKGNDHQRSVALKALSGDMTFRNLRSGTRVSPIFGRKRPAAFLVAGDKQRTIFSAEQSQTLPGKTVRAEGSKPSGDPAVDEAYDGLGATYDFFWEQFKRNSIDDEGMPMNGTVHFGEDYANAFWDGQRMVFGDGDNELFNRFTLSLDVIAHELTHGVTEDEAQLMYSGQSGALNESVSDVFGSLVKQYALKQSADEADWLIGAELFTDKVKGTNGNPAAIRSMKDPGSAYNDPVLGKDPQPKHMKDFVNTFEDNGGVHINSGIPNHAFYLAATAIGGKAWEKAGRVWYETLIDARLKSNATFQRFAELTIENAKRFNVEEAITKAWSQVGISLAV
ncbi:M4 family metallopeptidase [Adhaeribacter radiodurans]|uniref:Neutral metalloproteinase n=1 Tax=Adhaeribacter radiodurans TaxID=2745197 RepID=A0A7L7L252_9BACT|nr:M4 family metallopeptidase [Adhaeribacter radiodurans]QMU26843.1 M4 family metallopeptidase [Adhaeribacter radiodurans]